MNSEPQGNGEKMGDTDSRQMEHQPEGTAVQKPEQDGRKRPVLPAGMEPLPDLAMRRSREHQEKEAAREKERAERGIGTGQMLHTPFPVYGAMTEEKESSREESAPAEKESSREENTPAEKEFLRDDSGPEEKEPPEEDSKPSREDSVTEGETGAPGTEVQPPEDETNASGTEVQPPEGQMESPVDTDLPGSGAGPAENRGKRGRLPVVILAVAAGACVMAGLAYRQHSSSRSPEENVASAAVTAASVQAIPAGSTEGTAGETAAAVGTTESSALSGSGTESIENKSEQENEASAAWPTASWSAGQAAFVPEGLSSTAALLVDLDEGQIVAQSDTGRRGEDPSDRASEGPEGVLLPETMEDLLILRDVCGQPGENSSGANAAPSMDDRLIVPAERLKQAEEENLPVTGFAEGEEVTLEDCLYGMMLTGGEDARAAVLSDVVLSDGSMESGTGSEGRAAAWSGEIRIEAGSLVAAMDQVMKLPSAAKILAADRYTTSVTTAHPAGLILENLFLKRLRLQEVAGAEIVAACSAYSEEAGACAVTRVVLQDQEGNVHNCICVSAGAPDAWQSVYDQASVLRQSTERAWSSRR